MEGSGVFAVAVYDAIDVTVEPKMLGVDERRSVRAIVAGNQAWPRSRAPASKLSLSLEHPLAQTDHNGVSYGLFEVETDLMSNTSAEFTTPNVASAGDVLKWSGTYTIAAPKGQPEYVNGEVMFSSPELCTVVDDSFDLDEPIQNEQATKTVFRDVGFSAFWLESEVTARSTRCDDTNIVTQNFAMVFGDCSVAGAPETASACAVRSRPVDSRGGGTISLRYRFGSHPAPVEGDISTRCVEDPTHTAAAYVQFRTDGLNWYTLGDALSYSMDWVLREMTLPPVARASSTELRIIAHSPDTRAHFAIDDVVLRLYPLQRPLEIQVDSIHPSSGPDTGGTAVTISGSFPTNTALRVAVGGQPCSGAVISAHQIACLTAPSAQLGLAAVNISGCGIQAAVDAPYFRYYEDPRFEGWPQQLPIHETRGQGQLRLRFSSSFTYFEAPDVQVSVSSRSEHCNISESYNAKLVQSNQLWSSAATDDNTARWRSFPLSSPDSDYTFKFIVGEGDLKRVAIEYPTLIQYLDLEVVMHEPMLPSNESYTRKFLRLLDGCGFAIHAGLVSGPVEDFFAGNPMSDSQLASNLTSHAVEYIPTSTTTGWARFRLLRSLPVPRETSGQYLGVQISEARTGNSTPGFDLRVRHLTHEIDVSASSAYASGDTHVRHARAPVMRLCASAECKGSATVLLNSEIRCDAPSTTQQQFCPDLEGHRLDVGLMVNGQQMANHKAQMTLYCVDEDTDVTIEPLVAPYVSPDPLHARTLITFAGLGSVSSLMQTWESTTSPIRAVAEFFHRETGVRGLGGCYLRDADVVCTVPTLDPSFSSSRHYFQAEVFLSINGQAFERRNRVRSLAMLLHAALLPERACQCSGGSDDIDCRALADPGCASRPAVKTYIPAAGGVRFRISGENVVNRAFFSLLSEWRVGDATEVAPDLVYCRWGRQCDGEERGSETCIRDESLIPKEYVVQRRGEEGYGTEIRTGVAEISPEIEVGIVGGTTQSLVPGRVVLNGDQQCRDGLCDVICTAPPRPWGSWVLQVTLNKQDYYSGPIVHESEHCGNHPRVREKPGPNFVVGEEAEFFDEKCQPCKPGSSNQDHSQHLTCPLCENGKYQPEEGATRCRVCSEAQEHWGGSGVPSDATQNIMGTYARYSEEELFSRTVVEGDHDSWYLRPPGATSADESCRCPRGYYFAYVDESKVTPGHCFARTELWDHSNYSYACCLPCPENSHCVPGGGRPFAHAGFRNEWAPHENRDLDPFAPSLGEWPPPKRCESGRCLVCNHTCQFARLECHFRQYEEFKDDRELPIEWMERCDFSCKCDYWHCYGGEQCSRCAPQVPVDDRGLPIDNFERTFVGHGFIPETEHRSSSRPWNDTWSLDYMGSSRAQVSASGRVSYYSFGNQCRRAWRRGATLLLPWCSARPYTDVIVMSGCPPTDVWQLALFFLAAIWTCVKFALYARWVKSVGSGRIFFSFVVGALAIYKFDVTWPKIIKQIQEFLAWILSFVSLNLIRVECVVPGLPWIYDFFGKMALPFLVLCFWVVAYVAVQVDEHRKSSFRTLEGAERYRCSNYCRNHVNAVDSWAKQRHSVKLASVDLRAFLQSCGEDTPESDGAGAVSPYLVPDTMSAALGSWLLDHDKCAKFKNSDKAVIICGHHPADEGHARHAQGTRPVYVGAALFREFLQTSARPGQEGPHATGGGMICPYSCSQCHAAAAARPIVQCRNCAKDSAKSILECANGTKTSRCVVDNFKLILRCTECTERDLGKLRKCQRCNWDLIKLLGPHVHSMVATREVKLGNCDMCTYGMLVSLFVTLPILLAIEVISWSSEMGNQVFVPLEETLQIATMKASLLVGLLGGGALVTGAAVAGCVRKSWMQPPSAASFQRFRSAFLFGFDVGIPCGAATTVIPGFSGTVGLGVVATVTIATAVARHHQFRQLWERMPYIPKLFVSLLAALASLCVVVISKGFYVCLWAYEVVRSLAVFSGRRGIIGSVILMSRPLAQPIDTTIYREEGVIRDRTWCCISAWKVLRSLCCGWGAACYWEPAGTRDHGRCNNPCYNVLFRQLRSLKDACSWERRGDNESTKAKVLVLHEAFEGATIPIHRQWRNVELTFADQALKFGDTHLSDIAIPDCPLPEKVIGHGPHVFEIYINNGEEKGKQRWVSLPTQARANAFLRQWRRHGGRDERPGGCTRLVLRACCVARSPRVEASSLLKTQSHDERAEFVFYNMCCIDNRTTWRGALLRLWWAPTLAPRSVAWIPVERHRRPTGLARLVALLFDVREHKWNKNSPHSRLYIARVRKAQNLARNAKPAVLFGFWSRVRILLRPRTDDISEMRMMQRKLGNGKAFQYLLRDDATKSFAAMTDDMQHHGLTRRTVTRAPISCNGFNVELEVGAVPVHREEKPRRSTGYVCLVNSNCEVVKEANNGATLEHLSMQLTDRAPAFQAQPGRATVSDLADDAKLIRTVTLGDAEGDLTAEERDDLLRDAVYYVLRAALQDSLDRIEIPPLCPRFAQVYMARTMFDEVISCLEGRERFRFSGEHRPALQRWRKLAVAFCVNDDESAQVFGDALRHAINDVNPACPPSVAEFRRSSGRRVASRLHGVYQSMCDDELNLRRMYRETILSRACQQNHPSQLPLISQVPVWQERVRAAELDYRRHRRPAQDDDATKEVEWPLEEVYSGAFRQNTRATIDILWNALMMFCTFAHSAVARLIWRAFLCREHKEGHSVLVADPGVVCWKSGDNWERDHVIILIVAFVLGGMFLVIVPTLILSWLCWMRHFRTQDQERTKARLGYLYLKYTPDRYYWELVVLCRKFAIIMLFNVSDLLQSSVPEHLFATLLVFVVALVAHTRASPFLEPHLNRLETVSLASSCVMVVMAYAYVYTDEETESASVGALVFALLFVAVMGCSTILLFGHMVAEVAEMLPILHHRTVIGFASRALAMMRQTGRPTPPRAHCHLCQLSSGVGYPPPDASPDEILFHQVYHTDDGFGVGNFMSDIDRVEMSALRRIHISPVPEGLLRAHFEDSSVPYREKRNLRRILQHDQLAAVEEFLGCSAERNAQKEEEEDHRRVRLWQRGQFWCFVVLDLMLALFVSMFCCGCYSVCRGQRRYHETRNSSHPRRKCAECCHSVLGGAFPQPVLPSEKLHALRLRTKECLIQLKDTLKKASEQQPDESVSDELSEWADSCEAAVRDINARDKHDSLDFGATRNFGATLRKRRTVGKDPEFGLDEPLRATQDHIHNLVFEDAQTDFSRMAESGHWCKLARLVVRLPDTAASAAGRSPIRHAAADERKIVEERESKDDAGAAASAPVNVGGEHDAKASDSDGDGYVRTRQGRRSDVMNGDRTAEEQSRPDEGADEQKSFGEIESKDDPDAAGEAASASPTRRTSAGSGTGEFGTGGESDGKVSPDAADEVGAASSHRLRARQGRGEESARRPIAGTTESSGGAAAVGEARPALPRRPLGHSDGGPALPHIGGGRLDPLPSHHPGGSSLGEPRPTRWWNGLEEGGGARMLGSASARSRLDEFGFARRWAGHDSGGHDGRASLRHTVLEEPAVPRTQTWLGRNGGPLSPASRVGNELRHPSGPDSE